MASLTVPSTSSTPRTMHNQERTSTEVIFFKDQTHLTLVLHFLSSQELVKLECVSKLFKQVAFQAAEMQYRSQETLTFSNLHAFAQYKNRSPKIASFASLFPYLARLTELDFSKWNFENSSYQLVQTLPYERLRQITSLNLSKAQNLTIEKLKMLLVGVAVNGGTGLDLDASSRNLFPNLNFLNFARTACFYKIDLEKFEREVVLFKNGYGTYICSNVDRFEGQWENGQLHGKGKILRPDMQMLLKLVPNFDFAIMNPTWTYVGEFERGVKHGQGKFTFPDGSIYEGNWHHGKQHGQGTKTYPCGTSYIGEWKEDKRDGRGISSFPDKTTYDGEWREDKEHGRGIITYPDGSTYNGSWQNGERQGQGERRSKSRRLLYTGGWDKDLKHGEGMALYRDGSSYGGKWHKNKWQGKGVYIDSTGRRYEGSWLEDDKGNRYMRFPMDAKF